MTILGYEPVGTGELMYIRPAVLFLLVSLFLGTAIARVSGQEIEGWRSDLRYLADRIAELHPDPWRRISREDFLRRVDAFADELPALSETQRLAQLMRLVSSIGDGHTRVHPRLADSAYQVFPLRIERFEEGVFITVAPVTNSNLIGARIQSVNGHEAKSVIDRLAGLNSGDNAFFARAWAAESFVFPHLLRGLGLIGENDILSLELELRDGTRVHGDIAAIPFDDRDAWFWWPFLGPAPKPGFYVNAFEGTGELPLFMNRQKKRYWFETIGENGWMYLFIQSFADLEEESFTAFQDRMFREMDERGIDRLIIDLRWNSGGNGKLVWPIVYNLIKRDRINTPGNLYVITGRKSFSATVLAVGQLKQHTRTVTIGEPMAAHYNGCGDPDTVTLPSTGYRVSISRLYWQVGYPADRRTIVAPDVIVPWHASDYFTGHDRALETILSGSAITLHELFLREGAEAGLKKLAEMVAIYRDIPGWDPIPEREMHDLGRDLRNADAFDAAIAVFQLNTERHPESWNAWDDLAGAWHKKGDRKQAAACYEKSLALNPGNDNARWKLRELAQMR